MKVISAVDKNLGAELNRHAFKLVLLAALVAGVAACGGSGGDSAVQSALGGQPPAATAQDYPAPTKVSDNLRFTAIAAGYEHTCAIATSGDTYCWGSNEYGQLGTSAKMSTCGVANFPCSGAPVRVEGGRQFIRLASSRIQTCALDEAGDAYCWGYGLGGQLGDGLRHNSVVPVAVAGGLHFTELTVGVTNGSACGITALGDAWCWGINDQGQLGNGTQQFAPTPAPVATSTKFKAISVGEMHTCALDLAGNALCWGNNWYGQLGVGSEGGSGGFTESLAPVAVLGGLRFVDVIAGSSHSCGLQDTGAAFCWGNPSLLGTAATNADHSLPVAVATTGARWQRLSRGFAQTCAGAADGALYCWGPRAGSAGSLPTRIEGGQPFAAFSAGHAHACAIGLDGLAYCWGDNWFGQVGRPPSDPMVR